jgi:hypothetical protein
LGSCAGEAHCKANFFTAKDAKEKQVLIVYG